MNYFLLSLVVLAVPLTAAVLFALWNYLFGPRVIRLLINKYLRKRRIAWVSLIAVTLCTAMVIVVISVMGGWLRMFRDSFHGLSGDIIVTKQSMAGFPYYQEMIEQIEKIDGVRAAVPMIHTFGLVNIAGGQIQYGVEVEGLPEDKIGEASRFRDSLYRQWQMADDPDATPEQRAEGQQIRQKAATFDKPFPADYYRNLKPAAAKKGLDVYSWPGMIVGVGVVGIQKDKEGHTHGRDYLYDADVRLTVMGLKDEPGTVSADQRNGAELLDRGRQPNEDLAIRRADGLCAAELSAKRFADGHAAGRESGRRSAARDGHPDRPQARLRHVRASSRRLKRSRTRCWRHMA